MINFPFVWGQGTIYKANRQISSNREGTEHQAMYFFNQYPMTFPHERVIVIHQGRRGNSSLRCLWDIEVSWLCRKQDTIETSESTRADSWLHIFPSFPFTTSFHLLISPSVPQTKDTFCLLCAWTPPPLIFSCLSMPSSQCK